MADEQVVKFRFTSDATGVVQEFDTLEGAQQALAAETRKADAALKAQAKQLGLTVSQTRKLNQAIQTLGPAERQAAAEAKRLAEAERLAAQEAERAAEAKRLAALEAKRLAEASELAAAKGRRTAQAMQSVAIQLPDVAAQAASGTDAFTILAQQGLQVVQVNFDLVTKAAKAARVAMGPLGLALAVVTAAAADLSNTAKAASEELDNLQAGANVIDGILRRDAKAAFEAADGINAARQATEEAALQTRILNGELTEAEAGFIRANRQIRAGAEGSLDAQKRLISTLNEAIRKQEQVAGAARAGTEAQREARAEIERLTSRREKATEQLIAQGLAVNEAIAAARELAAVQQAAADAADAEAAQRARNIELARLEAQAKRDAAAAQREYNAALRASQQEVSEIARKTNEGLREVEQAWQELLDEIDALLNQRAEQFEAHFARVATISQTFGSELVAQQGKIGQALLETGRQALAAETGQLAQEFALRAAAYALVGNLPAAAAHTAGAAALGVTSGVLQAGGIRALNGTGSRRGDRSGRR